MSDAKLDYFDLRKKFLDVLNGLAFYPMTDGSPNSKSELRNSSQTWQTAKGSTS